MSSRTSNVIFSVAISEGSLLHYRVLLEILDPSEVVFLTDPIVLGVLEGSSPGVQPSVLC